MKRRWDIVAQLNQNKREKGHCFAGVLESKGDSTFLHRMKRRWDIFAQVCQNEKEVEQFLHRCVRMKREWDIFAQVSQNEKEVGHFCTGVSE
jgi:hypothetical protein